MFFYENTVVDEANCAGENMFFKYSDLCKLDKKRSQAYEEAKCCDTILTKEKF